MCKKYHPDVNKTQDAEAKFRWVWKCLFWSVSDENTVKNPKENFREIRAAYEVLSNRGLRQKYDAKEKWSRQMHDTNWEEKKAPNKNESRDIRREWRSFNRNETGKDSEFKFEERYYRFHDDNQKFRDEVYEALRRRREAHKKGYQVKMWRKRCFSHSTIRPLLRHGRSSSSGHFLKDPELFIREVVSQ